MSTKLILTFATRYNGIALNFVDDNIHPTDEQFTVFDAVGDTLPGFTGEWANNWEHTLSEDNINELCKMVIDMVSPVIPDAEVDFEYDHTST